MEKVERSYAWFVQCHEKLQDERRSIGRIAIWLDSASSWGFRQRAWRRTFWISWSRSEKGGKESIAKFLLDKSKFERELKRLECSINYEGGKKQKCGTQERWGQILEV